MRWNGTRPGTVVPIVTDIEFGLDTFGGVTRDAAGDPVPHPQVVRDVVEEAVLADSVGLDFFGRSEEHTSELQSRETLVCRLLLDKKNNSIYRATILESSLYLEPDHN